MSAPLCHNNSLIGMQHLVVIIVLTYCTEIGPEADLYEKRDAVFGPDANLLDIYGHFQTWSSRLTVFHNIQMYITARS